MATYPLSTLGPTVGPTGISAPAYADILASLKSSAATIFGSDVYLEADSQDGQLLAIFAQAISDSNDAAIAAYNSMSPQTALGAALSSRVKINGLTRALPSNSQASMTLTGTVGTTITNGLVSDVNGNTWALPASVTIPSAGFVTATATCTTAGAISAAPNTINQIATPQSGWQSATNATSASQGAPVESDPALKARQSQSVALPALNVTAGIVAAVKALTGVTDVIPYDNDTNTTDANGTPAHSLALVVKGGDDTAVATTINLKKGPGGGTYGNTSVTITDFSGAPKVLKFYRPVAVPLSVSVTIRALTGYVSTTGDALKQALVDYITALVTGNPVYLTRLYLPAQLNGAALSSTYELTSILISKKPAAPASSDLTFAIYEEATLALADIALTVT